MRIPRILLVGVAQSDWQNWRFGPPTAAYVPYANNQDGIMRCGETCGLPFPILQEPVFNKTIFDGVVFTIPNDGKIREDLVLNAMEAGMPSLVLKMRPNGAETMRQLSSLPEFSRRRLFVGDQYRYHRGATAVLTALREGRIGTPVFTSWRCALPEPGSSPWMDAYAHLTLEDLAYHHLMTLFAGLDSLQVGTLVPSSNPETLPDAVENLSGMVCAASAESLTGKVKEEGIACLSGTVYAASFNPGWLSERKKGYCMLLGRMDSGLVLQYETRWGAPVKTGQFFGEWLVEGDKGSLLTDGEHALFTNRNGLVESLLLPEARYAGWSGIVDHFMEVLMGVEDRNVLPLAGYDRYAAVDGLIRAGICSSEENRAVRFP